MSRLTCMVLLAWLMLATMQQPAWWQTGGSRGPGVGASRQMLARINNRAATMLQIVRIYNLLNSLINSQNDFIQLIDLHSYPSGTIYTPYKQCKRPCSEQSRSCGACGSVGNRPQ